MPPRKGSAFHEPSHSICCQVAPGRRVHAWVRRLVLPLLVVLPLSTAWTKEADQNIASRQSNPASATATSTNSPRFTIPVATPYTANASLFVQAVGTPNAIVNIAGNAHIDLTGYESIAVASGVRIIGDRSRFPTGPVIFTNSFPRILLLLKNDNVRISGVRLQGAESDDPFSAVDQSESDGIQINSAREIEIDHCEIDHWRGSAIAVRDENSRIDLQSAATIWLHDDYLHHNQHPTHDGEIPGGGHGAGYGVMVSDGAYALIEKNVFDYNRHSIAGDGSAGSGYLLYRNLILPGGGINSRQTFGILIYTHAIDMHGTSTCGLFGVPYGCGSAGEYMDVEYNTVLYTRDNGIHLRGTPEIAMDVRNNVFADSSESNAIVQNEYGLRAADNVFGYNAMSQMPVCDFDGDGVGDQFLATGATWWFKASTLNGRWVYLNQSSLRYSNLTLSDFDGDGRCDVSAGGEVFVRERATIVKGTMVGADRRADLAMIGRSDQASIVVAAANSDGTFSMIENVGSIFSAWAAVRGAKILQGDFNGDSRMDIALVGGYPQRWNTVPMAFSNGDGTYSFINAAVGDFGSWAAVPNVKSLTGDFNGDGRTDIALIGGDPAWWRSVPIAFSNGDGSFSISNSPVGDFSAWSTVANVKTLVADFNGDRRDDLALIGGDPSWWHTMPVAFSTGSGGFSISNTWIGDFSAWAAASNVKVLVGDFNGDKRADVALTGGDPSWWQSIPVAFSYGNGAFGITNGSAPAFAAWSAAANVKPLTGDFNGDGLTDILLYGGHPSWFYGLPVAFSNGNGTFNVTAYAAGDFAASPSPSPLAMYSADFNGDGRSDLAILGQAGKLPIAYSLGNGSFDVKDSTADDFASLAESPRSPTPSTSQPVPEVRRLTESAAKIRLINAGYTPKVGRYIDYSCSLTQGNVVLQNPPAGPAVLLRGVPVPPVEIRIAEWPVCHG